MNFLDKAIGLVSPGSALRRARERYALGVTEGYTKRHAERYSYDGATAGRRAAGWYAASTDANVELLGSLIWLRNRSRDLVRNNPYATRMVEELVGNTVGTGIVPQAKTGDSKLNKIIDAEWPYFAENCDPGGQMDFYALQALIMRTTAESGEGIIRYRPRLSRDGLRVPLQLQILESDHLDASRTMGTPDGGHIVQGVEFDPIGRRRFYWLFANHPGAAILFNPRGGIISKQVPASEVLHNYRILRPGQVRGVPWLAPVMSALRDHDDYRDAEGVRKKIEACMVAMVTQSDGMDGGPMGLNATTDPLSPTGAPVESFEPGMIKYLKPGQDVKFNTPQAAGGYREYTMTEVQRIMAGVCVPYELGSGDMSNVNFSSWRGGMLGFRNTIEAFRWIMLIPQTCMAVRRRFIDTLVLIGKIPGAAAVDPNIHLYATEWTAPKFESVDPVKDAEATLKEVRMGTLTLTEAIVQNGYDPERQLAEIARVNKVLDELEIIVDCDPRNMTLRGQEQAAGTAERTPSSKPVAGTGSGSKMTRATTPEEFRAAMAEVGEKVNFLAACAVDKSLDRTSMHKRTFVS
jgi:lambda family phage portal protein